MSVKGRKILITGGLGFIGLNAVECFSKNNDVCVIDDGSRIGCDEYKGFIESKGVRFFQLDISNMAALRPVYETFCPDIVLHLAAQVAVTLSIKNPMRDFFSNLQGSMNLLELARHSAVKPIFLYASTNKVYGQQKENIVLENGRYHLVGRLGYDEDTPLSFHTPYGCSKGAADQYVLDYARTYGLPTVVLRQSCIYGPYQYGFEDQGWLAWFAIGAALNKTLTVYGDGCQVRDVLYIDDLLDLYERCIEKIDQVKGQAFNIGGGPAHTLSINELIKMIENNTGHSLPVKYTDWRLGDQKVFICDIQKAKHFLGWDPKVSVVDGVRLLMQWIASQKQGIAQIHDNEQYIGKRIDVSIVIPAKNEEDSLPSVLDEIKALLDLSQYKMEVILVNDRSTDKTVAIGLKYPFVTIVDNQFNPGKGGALRSGFEKTRGEYIVMMDADFSHDAKDMTVMIEEVRRHKGLVVGSRIIGGSEEYTRVRAFGNIMLTWFFGFVHGRYLSDALNGYKIFHKDIFWQYAYTSDNFEIEVELLANTLKLGRPITEVPSRERSRLGGKAKSLVVKHGLLFMFRIIYEKFRKVILRRG